MRGSGLAFAAAVAACALSAAPAPAQTQPAFKLRADAGRAGRIALVLSGPAGAKLTVIEETAGPRRVGEVTLDKRGAARLSDAGRWRCDQRRRRFVATGNAPDGTFLGDNAQLVTPGCANRYRVEVRGGRPRVDDAIEVRVTDSFALGRPDGRLCARGPEGGRACTPIRRGRATLRLRRAGVWRIAAPRAAPVRVRVLPEPGPARVLAAGDSMIQIVDGFLDERLEGPFTSDARISTGLSKPFMFNWPAHAKRQVRRLRPDATVMFIGANDGFAFGDVQCCGTAWRRAYASRASQMMRTYSQGGDARVYWALLPAPRPANFRRVFVAVNAAILRAAERHRRDVRVIDLPRTFTPGFEFRQHITWRGRSVSVRQDDGIHLNVAGASIAASLIAARMRRDGLR